jgi:hypothetical protein
VTLGSEVQRRILKLAVAETSLNFENSSIFSAWEIFAFASVEPLVTASCQLREKGPVGL